MQPGYRAQRVDFPRRWRRHRVHGAAPAGSRRAARNWPWRTLRPRTWAASARCRRRQGASYPQSPVLLVWCVQGRGDLGAEEDLAHRRKRQHSLGCASPMNEPPDRHSRRLTAAVSACTTCSIQMIATPSAEIERTMSVQLRHLGIGEAARHLVEQQQPRAGGECPRQLEPLARAARAAPLDCWPPPTARSWRAPDRPGVTLAPPRRRLAARPRERLEYGHRAERLGHLERAPDAEPAPRGRVLPGDGRPGECDDAAAGVRSPAISPNRLLCLRRRLDDADQLELARSRATDYPRPRPCRSSCSLRKLQQGRARGFRHSSGRGSPGSSRWSSASCPRPASRTDCSRRAAASTARRWAG